MNGTLLRDERELGIHFGRSRGKGDRGFPPQGRRRCCRRRAGTAGSGPTTIAHPWASRTCADILDEVQEPDRRGGYIEITAHSDMATEPHLTTGLIGLRNFLKSVPGYGAQYSIEGGMEMLPRALASSLVRTDVVLDTPVVQMSRRPSRPLHPLPPGVPGSSPNTSRQRGARASFRGLPEITWAGERLRRAMAAISPATSGPAATCASRSCSFGRSGVIDCRDPGSCSTRSAAAASMRILLRTVPESRSVLGWLLAGSEALSSCNSDDRTLIARVLESLPDDLYAEARRHMIEGKVHRWAGAVSGQPGGCPLRDIITAHQPEPHEHPGLVVVGDYLSDSTLNGVLRSAQIATDLLRARCKSQSRLCASLLSAPFCVLP